MDQHDVCGIEVSAKCLLAGLEREGAAGVQREFPNTPEGRTALARWLGAPGRAVRVVMEATGLYGLDLALRLDAEPGLELMVANPRAVRHFAYALMKRSKNDPMDADVLLEFARRMPFHRWTRPSPAALALHALARRLESLTAMRAAEKNRLHAAQLSPALPAAGVPGRGVLFDAQFCSPSALGNQALDNLQFPAARLHSAAVRVILPGSGGIESGNHG
jgi:transposase